MASSSLTPTSVSAHEQCVRAVAHVHELIAAGAPAEQVFQAVLDGAVELFDGFTGALRFVDRDAPDWMVAVAMYDVVGADERWRQRAPTTEGMSGKAITTGRLAIQEAGATREGVASTLAPAGTQAAMAVPLRERGHIFGSLVIGTAQPGRRWTEAERDLMTAYGRHVEVALAVARAQDGLVQAHADALTGLPNRAALLDRLEHRLAQADRGGAPVTVLFLDLDGFKLINDSLGHEFGDLLLVATSARLRRCVRSEDLCARLGGDEFAVLLAETSDPDGVAARVIDAVGERFSLGGREMFVTVSVGIATGCGAAETLLGNADMAMYHAKRTGPGTRAHFEPTMRAARMSRLGLEADLRRAVADNQFELNFQPLVGVASREIVGFECLVRWRHPERGIVPPPVFITAAEETGLIVDIDCWVLEETCRTLAAWSRHRSLVMTANVSVAALGDPRYAAVVEREVGNLIHPSSLVIEVTESANLSETPAALATLRAIKALGAGVALDDFGTGYSTLATLSQLPVDIVKVPRPFLIAEMAEGGVDPDRMLAGVIGLGRQLGLHTVVEGIETEEQLATVTAHGADIAQGYLLGRPSDGATAEALLLAPAGAPRPLASAAAA